jgi:hypothetical protein
LAYLTAWPIYVPKQSLRNRIGAAIYLAIFVPVMVIAEKLTKLTLRSDGSVPMMVKLLVRAVLVIIWAVHDGIFAPIFGRGDGVDDRENYNDEQTRLFSEKTPLIERQPILYTSNAQDLGLASMNLSGNACVKELLP